MHTPNFGITFRIKEQLAIRHSPYQTVQILDTCEMGRMLVIDGLVMTTERDEAAYHEMIVHVPMFSHPDPKHVLVIGGGDGGALREIIKHPELDKAIQVEIDNEVVDLCKEFLPDIASAYDNPKVELIIGDAIEYLRNVNNRFDVVIIDGSDPVGPAEGLFTHQFFSSVKTALRDGGFASGQIGSPFISGERTRQTMQILSEVFFDARLYTTHTPTYLPGLWAMFLASKSDKINIDADKVRYRTFESTLKYYNKFIHKGAFQLPNYIQNLVNPANGILKEN